MNLQEFKATLAETLPPKELTPTLAASSDVGAYARAALAALWYAGKNNWEKAHTIAQDIPTREGAWVHAYLHREEGDKGNAQYWYDRAGRKMPSYSLGEEWDKMVAELLASH
jgi:hypothetical protein